MFAQEPSISRIYPNVIHKNTNERTMKNFLAAILTFCLIESYAQQTQIDHVTGTMTMQIPITTISDKDIQFPIGLSYSASAIKVTSVSGWTGQNWNLSADVGVSREVRSLPDDYLGTSPDTRKGWLHGDMGTRISSFTISDDNNPSTCPDELSNYNFLNTFGYNEDTEPDIFSVNVPGLSFQFLYDENKQPRVVPDQDVLVARTMDVATNRIKSFTITNSKGISYLFENVESITETATQNSTADLKDYILKRQYELYKTSCTYNISWRLTRITSPLGGQIEFSYRPVPIVGKPWVVKNAKGLKFKYPLPFENAPFHSEQKVLIYNRTVSQIVLQKVFTSNLEIEFIPLLKQDDSEVLSNIKVSDKRSGSLQLVRDFALDFKTQLYFEVDPNDPTGVEINPDFPGLIVVGSRSFLTSITEKTGGSELPPYVFEYWGLDQYGNTIFPTPGVKVKDEWGYFKNANKTYWTTLPALSMRESEQIGVMKKAIYPLGGYAAFFYEPHEYYDAALAATITGAGVRLRKIISHDALSSSSDIVQEFQYTKTDGQSSGNLIQRPTKAMSTVSLDRVYSAIGGPSVIAPKYRDIQLLVNAGTWQAPVSQYFILKAPENLGDEVTVNGSHVAYKRVIAKRKDAGRTIYEYSIPGLADDVTANNNEWEPSKVFIARPSTGTSSCFEIGSIPTGFRQYPYPPDPNYGFERGLLMKVTDEDEFGNKVRDVIFEYQRIYAGTGIRKIFGIALAELPTYYYNGSSYVNAKMFLFGKYPVFTEVKNALKKETETLYYSTDLTKKQETVTDYLYDNVNHRELIQVNKKNSDQLENITKYKYVNDYTLTTASGSPAQSLQTLKNQHQNIVVESTSSVKNGAIEKFTSGALTVFQTISGKVYPYQQYTMRAPEGNSSFSISTIAAGVFTFDQTNYKLAESYLSFDDADWKESVGIDRQKSTIIRGYNKTLPIVVASNAGANEIAFSDFETQTEIEFTPSSTPTIVAGRTGTKGLSIPAGSTYKLSRLITNLQSQQYQFSCWAKAGSNGNIIIKLKNGATDLITPIQLPVSSSSDYRYYALHIVTTSLPAIFTIEVTSSIALTVDEVSFYPAHATVMSYAYELPYGKSSETDGRGNSIFYKYDVWGRPIATYDRNKNVVNKMDYKIRQ
jgi:hypothetical protein